MNCVVGMPAQRKRNAYIQGNLECACSADYIS